MQDFVAQAKDSAKRALAETQRTSDGCRGARRVRGAAQNPWELLPGTRASRGTCLICYGLSHSPRGISGPLGFGLAHTRTLSEFHEFMLGAFAAFAHTHSNGLLCRRSRSTC